MSLIHIDAGPNDKMGYFDWYPLCGRGDGEVHYDDSRATCWECRSIAGLPECEDRR